MTISSDFPAQLKEVRKSKGLTQEQMAELLDVQARWIQYLESGNKTPSEKLMKKICEIFPELQQQQ